MASKNAEPALVAENICKTFAGASQAALSEINLAVMPGEFYSFLGPSGCGKTTMLRIFAGFETATSGSIKVDGRSMDGVPANKRPVNMVFQSYALFPHLTVVENVAFGLRAAGKVPKGEIISRSRDALNTVRLGNLADRMPAQLSGGQQQRVALARALVMRPVVLLLDEPLSALDVQIREEMQEELSRLQKEIGVTFVMVTHDQGEALALSSRVAVFNQGRIEQIGEPATIYQNPQTAFVARFIGRSNVLSGQVLSVAADFFEFGLADIRGQKALRCPFLVGVPHPVVGQNVAVCIKPEAVAPAVSTTGELNRLVCTLESSSFLGSLVDLRLRIVGADRPEIIRATISAQTFADLNVHLSKATLPAFDIVLPPAELRLLTDGPANPAIEAARVDPGVVPA